MLFHEIQNLLYTKVFTLFSHRNPKCAKMSDRIENFWPLGSFVQLLSILLDHWQGRKDWKISDQLKVCSQRYTNVNVDKYIHHWCHNTYTLVTRHCRDYNREDVSCHNFLCCRQGNSQIFETCQWGKETNRDINFYLLAYFITEY